MSKIQNKLNMVRDARKWDDKVFEITSPLPQNCGNPAPCNPKYNPPPTPIFPSGRVCKRVPSRMASQATVVWIQRAKRR